MEYFCESCPTVFDSLHVRGTVIQKGLQASHRFQTDALVPAALNLFAPFSIPGGDALMLLLESVVSDRLIPSHGTFNFDDFVVPQSVMCVLGTLTQVLPVAPQLIYVLGTVPCGLTINQLALVLAAAGWMVSGMVLESPIQAQGRLPSFAFAST